MSEAPSWRMKRRLAIVRAAARLFARGAFARVQMDEIAREAGVGKPTLYRYFPSKEELYLAVCEEAFLRLQPKLDEASRDCPPAEGLARIIAVLVEFLDEQMTALDVFDHAAAPLPERWRALFRRHRQSIAAPLRAVLTAGVERSDFHNFDIEIAPGLIIGTIRGGLAGNPGVPRKRLIEQMTTFILSGLGADAVRCRQASRPSQRPRRVGVS